MTLFVIAENSSDDELHLTLMPAFQFVTDSSISGIVNALEVDKPIELTSTGIAKFTSQFDEPVQVLTVEATNQIMSLHSELLNRITLAGGRPVNPMIVGNGFRPHITGADEETELPSLNRIIATKLNDDGQFENIASIEINKG